jgi:hypothetical protein
LRKTKILIVGTHDADGVRNVTHFLQGMGGWQVVTK